MNFRISVTHEAEKILDRLDRPGEQPIRAGSSNWPLTRSIHASPRLLLNGPAFASPGWVDGAFYSLSIVRPNG